MNNGRVKTFNRWRLRPAEVKGLDATRARDLFVDCFFEAQKETLSRAKRNLGFETNDEEMKRATATIVKMAFKEVGADFERPTRKSLEKVLDTLTHKAEAWGTPEDIIEHHRQQLGMMLTMLD